MLETSVTNVLFAGAIVNNRELKSAQLDITVDKKSVFSIASELQVNSDQTISHISATGRRLQNILMSL